jgi:uncharacterized 2Fe-2S/4Fe-4S cluster protein (DUF4445 family)
MKQDTQNKARIIFEPGTVEACNDNNETLLDCARQAGVKIASACGGRGICKTCIVHFTGGDVPQASDSDRVFFSSAKLEKGWRRACQTTPVADCQIHIPARARAESSRMQVDGSEFWIEPDPVVSTIKVKLEPPTLADQRGDNERLLHAVNQQLTGGCSSIDIYLLRVLPDILRRNKWSVQAVIRQDEIVAVLPADARLVGLAIDIGTTNVGIFLVDLHSGTTLASTGVENPQGKYGSDVIARIGVAVQYPEKAVEMHRLLVDAVNDAVAGMCRSHDLAPEQIADVVVAGNTAMHHLFLQLPVKGLGMAPFAPVLTYASDIKSTATGLITAPGACIHMMANIAGFVGGDHTAMLIGICAATETRTVIALDIGTNTEISLLHEGRITSLSCPSGPALEGGHISCGMRASTGAIEAVSLAGEKLKLTTIGDTEPVGLCGSAVVDATAAFYLDGGLNHRGQIQQDYRHTVMCDSEPGFLLHAGETEVVFTQKDVRSVQLAKGSIRAGIDLLLEHAGLEYEQLDRIVVAGAFGNYINIESACAIGMLPPLPLEVFEQVGNAAGIGAKLVLVSKSLRATASEIASRSKHLIQAGNPRFNTLFMNSINFHEIN